MDLTEVLKNLMDQMTDGDAEWHMPWHGLKRLPRNVSSGKGYSGINKLILWAKSTNCGYASQHWGTFQQWRRIGQPVGRRERGTVLVMPITKRGQAGGEQLLGFRTYHVFNRDQVLNRNEGHPDLFGNLVNVVESETVEHLVRSTNAAIQTGGNAAAYNPIDDRIRIPTPDSFVATRYSTPTQNYYSTLLHELVHWTGHESRENRFGRDTPSVEEYAFEELVAEIGAAFLCSELELEDVPRNQGRLKEVDMKKYASEDVGEPTIKDILEEIARPGRDPRRQFRYATFKEGISEIKDLTPGLELEGVVTNVTNFGAFVDVGVHHDGLVHVSQLADRYVADPKSVVRVGQIVKVKVLEVNEAQKRISLTMKGFAPPRPKRPAKKPQKRQGEGQQQGQQQGRQQGRPQGQQPGEQHPQQEKREQKPRPEPRDERTYTLEDLKSKFNSR